MSWTRTQACCHLRGLLLAMRQGLFGAFVCGRILIAYHDAHPLMHPGTCCGFGQRRKLLI